MHLIASAAVAAAVSSSQTRETLLIPSKLLLLPLRSKNAASRAKQQNADSYICTLIKQQLLILLPRGVWMDRGAHTVTRGAP